MKISNFVSWSDENVPGEQYKLTVWCIEIQLTCIPSISNYSSFNFFNPQVWLLILFKKIVRI